MSDRRFFSGDSLAQALNQAAQYFQMTPAEINYRLVDKRHGFLKVRRKVVIEVDGAAPGHAPAAAPQAGASQSPPAEASAAPSSEASPEWSSEASPSPPSEAPPAPPSEAPPAPPRAEALPEPSPGALPDRAAVPGPPPPPTVSRRMLEPDDTEDGAIPEPSPEPPAAEEVTLPEAPPPATTRFPGAKGDEAEAAADALDRILELGGLELESEILQGEEELRVELWGGDQSILLRDRGRLLLAIQHLLPRAIRGLIGRSVACRVDSDDFHMIREERLRDMAQRAADEVRHRGRPKTLEPMSPDERRIVHLTLADYPGVETESHGSGLFKRVMVRASRGDRPQGSDRYDRR